MSSLVKMERQKKLGPAPFASIEDLADPDLSSPESKGYTKMPEICEEHPVSEASASTSTAQTPTTPRIDVEQASSPSQNESGDSTPERELFGLDSGHLSSSFLEGAADVDLRSSAEELSIPYVGRKVPVLSAVARRKVSWDAGDVRRRHQEHAAIERKVSSGTGRSSAEPPQSRDTRLSSVSSGMSALSALSSSRRSPSPHRMLVETSFCGPKTQAAAAAEVEHELDKLESDVSRRPSLLNPSTWFGDSRCNSPLNSPISPTSIRAFMIKYATEPRSRPTSPMGWASSANSPTPTPGLTASDSMQSRWLASPRLQRRASSPHRTLLETSFCGQKQMQVPGDEVAPRGPSPAPPTLLAIHAKPVRYATEPRSRPTSPTVHRSLLSSPVPPSSDTRRGSQSSRCVSPMIETSFCGPKRILPRDSDDDIKPATLPGTPSKSGDLSRTGSLRPVRYATEPRSRPTSPAPSLNYYPPDSPRLRSKSPAPVETSFCGNVRRQESIPAPPPSAPREVTQVSIHPQPVKYSTEPRSRSASPIPTSLLNHCPSPGPERRSPSPRMVVETSFIGPKKQDSLADQESLTSEPPSRAGSFRLPPASPVRYATEPRSRSASPAPKLLSGTPDPSRKRSPSPHRTLVETSFCGPKQIPRQESVQQEVKIQQDPVQPRPVSPSASTDSMSSEISLARHMRPDLPIIDNANEKRQEIEEFVAQWPDQPTSQTSWPVMSTFEPSPAPSGDSPPSQNSNGHIVPPANNTQAASPAKPGRHLPKPVACPKPPESFHPHPLESSPVLARRAVDVQSDAATPSPSSPFPSRRTSVNSGFFHHEEERANQEEGPPVKEKKNRSVLSVLFGKKKPKDDDEDSESKPAARNLTLPVKSRESSPGRSIGESGDDLDDEEGFQHEILDGGNESGDNMLDGELASEAKAAVPHEELGLFHQDSIEDELPYVPTTLPIERPVAPVITPVRMRISQVKTTPIERPRCSVTFAPRPIAEFVQIARSDSLESDAKIKVSLPRPEREDSEEEAPPPVRPSIGGVKWEAFSEQVFRVSRKRRAMRPVQECIPEEPPETPNDCVKAAREVKPQWVNVEELPELIKEAKAIKVLTTAPSTERDRVKRDNGIDEEANEEDDEEMQQSAPLLEEDEDDADDGGGKAASLLAPEQQRKDSVSSETALLREIEEPELDDRSHVPEFDGDDIDDASAVSNREQRSQSSSSLDELDSNLDESEAASLVRNNLLAAAPFGMDLDVPSNRSSIAIPSDVPSPDELSISLK